MTEKDALEKKITATKAELRLPLEETLVTKRDFPREDLVRSPSVYPCIYIITVVHFGVLLLIPYSCNSYIIYHRMCILNVITVVT